MYKDPQIRYPLFPETLHVRVLVRFLVLRRLIERESLSGGRLEFHGRLLGL